MKKSVKIILIGIIIVLLFVIMFGFFNSKKEKNEFQVFLDKAYDKVNEHKKTKLNMDITVDGDISDEFNSELLRDVSINTVLNYDLSKDIYLMDFNSNYKGSSIVNGNMYYEKDLYVNLNDLSDSVIKTNDYNIGVKGVIDSFYKALDNALSEGEYESSRKEGYDVFTLVINDKNRDKVVKQFVNTLKKNKELIKILDELNINVKDFKLNGDIRVDLYTHNNEFEKLIVYKGEKEIGYITPSEKNIKIKLYGDVIKIMTIVSKHKDNSFSITSNIYIRDKSLNIGAKVSYSFDEEIEKPNIEKAVKLRKDDKKKIEEKFNNSEGMLRFKEDSEKIEKEEENKLENEELIKLPNIIR